MSRSRVRRDVLSDPPAGLAEYGSLYVLLVAATLVQLLLGDLAREIGDLIPYYVTPRAFGTVVYAGLGMAVVAICYLAYRQTREFDSRLSTHELASLALALSLLFLGVAYALLGRVSPPGFATSLLGTFVTSVVGLGLLAVAYLRARSERFRFAFPERFAIRSLLIAIIGPVLVVSALSLVATSGMLGSSRWMLGGQYARTVSLANLVQSAVVQSAFVAFGTGLLFHGAIQETVREYATSTGAIAGVTALVGVYGLVFPLVLRVDGARSLLSIAVAVALIVLSTAVVVRLWNTEGRLWWVLSPVGGDRPEVASAGAFGLLAVAIIAGAGHFAIDSLGASIVGYALGYTATAGIGAVTYERTRSVWVPVLAFWVFLATVELAGHVATT